MLSNPPSRRLGAVLAGGMAQRFGGDKAAALVGGIPLLELAARAIAPVCAEVVVVGRDWPGRPSVPDLPTGGLGPLGGLLGALEYCNANNFSSVLTIACDMPELPPDVRDLLLAGGSRWCAEAPVVGCWSADLRPHLDRWLASGDDRSVRRWARAAGALPVAEGRALTNVNTPADLAAL